MVTILVTTYTLVTPSHRSCLALPLSIDLPRGSEDPDTGATTIEDPFWYDMTLDQNLVEVDFLTQSTGSQGDVGYHFAHRDTLILADVRPALFLVSLRTWERT